MILLSWDKFYRNIKLELAKSRNERTPVYQMLKSSKEEFDRLMEISPDIEDKVLDKFKMVIYNKEKDDDDVAISKAKISHFTNRNKPIQYWIALEPDSEF